MSAHNQQVGEIYRRMYDFLLQYAKSTLGNYGLAEEAVQETFVIACLKAEDLCSSENPEGWLVKTLKNVMWNTKRGRAQADRVLTEYMTVQTRAGVTEDPIRLELLYGDLADTEEFLLLREMAVEGYSHLEMAKKRGITVVTCRKRVQRAKEILRKNILK